MRCFVGPLIRRVTKLFIVLVERVCVAACPLTSFPHNIHFMQKPFSMQICENGYTYSKHCYWGIGPSGGGGGNGTNHHVVFIFLSIKAF